MSILPPSPRLTDGSKKLLLLLPILNQIFPQQHPKLILGLLVLVYNFLPFPAWALGLPSEDIPEEVLRLEIITSARSPLDGKPIDSWQYAEIIEKIKTSPYSPQLNPKVGNVIFLLQLRQLLKSIIFSL
ncbi:MAG: hypothetical protein WCO81_03250 [Cyanobacteriota bacterium ELA615]